MPRKLGEKQTKYTMEEKLQAALAYAITGSSVKASKLCGIPDKTIRVWTNTEWWPDLIVEARQQKQKELDGRLTGIIHTAIGNIEERLKVGDPVMNAKTGEIHYKPVGAKESAIITGVFIDKRALMRGEATRRTENVTTSQQLKEIKNGLEQLASPRDKKDLDEVLH